LGVGADGRQVVADRGLLDTGQQLLASVEFAVEEVHGLRGGEHRAGPQIGAAVVPGGGRRRHDQPGDVQWTVRPVAAQRQVLQNVNDQAGVQLCRFGNQHPFDGGGVGPLSGLLLVQPLLLGTRGRAAAFQYSHQGWVNRTVVIATTV
jgi:hypothetical protein